MHALAPYCTPALAHASCAGDFLRLEVVGKDLDRNLTRKLRERGLLRHIVRGRANRAATAAF